MPISLTLSTKFSASETPFGIQRYDFFSASHLLIILLTFTILIACCAIFANKPHWLERVLTVASISTAVTILLTAVYFVYSGEYNIELYLPFHLCNLFLFILPIAKTGSQKTRTFLYDYMSLAGLMGCMLCAVFPVTSMAYYPVFHPVSLLVWLHHLTIGILGVFLLSSGVYRPLKLFNLLIMLSAMIVAAVIVNALTGANFLFLNPKYTLPPLNYIQDIFAPIGIWAAVIIIYALAVLMRLTITQPECSVTLPFWVASKKYNN